MTAAAAGRTRARRGDGDLLRGELLRAAEELLVEAGDSSRITLRAVAKRARVTTPSVYLHFTDKAALVDAVCLSVWHKLGRRMDEAAADAPDPFDGLRRRGMAYVRFGLDHPVHYRVLMMQPPPPAATGGAAAVAARDCFAHMLDAVAACVRVGVFRGEPEPLALSLWAAVHGVISLLISKPNFPWPDDVDGFVDDCVRMAGMGAAVVSRVPAGEGRPGARGLARQLDTLVAGLHHPPHDHPQHGEGRRAVTDRQGEPA